ncbi:hypothetical protein C0Q70_09200 [Pomacea canaliculata]|uniref:HAT C-terminal dimerisation domain-containing protein n=1 Tax=Pomacea canaliculata TaxID=400727 RepID=A0A2T7P948_POMCA|nr:hypothetical protein C0Q70_09200 [Pomacea canaliculata]
MDIVRTMIGEMLIKMVNFVKNSSARSRLFSMIYQDMGADYDALLYYCESRWLSHGKALARVFELREELWVFLKENSFNKADLLKNDRLLLLMAYLSDIFEKLNVVNTSVQGKDKTILQTTDKMNAFFRKIWITSGLSTQEEEQLTDLSSDQCLKMVFQTTPVPKFWISVNGEYPLLSTSYVSEQGFSALAALKSKYRNRLDAEADLRIALQDLDTRHGVTVPGEGRSQVLEAAYLLELYSM